MEHQEVHIRRQVELDLLETGQIESRTWLHNERQSGRLCDESLMCYDEDVCFRERLLRPKPFLTDEPVVLCFKVLGETGRVRLCFISRVRKGLVVIGDQGGRPNKVVKNA